MMALGREDVGGQLRVAEQGGILPLVRLLRVPRTSSQVLLADVCALASLCIGLCFMIHDPANVQQTYSKCIQNTRANAGRLLKICWTFAGSCKHPISLPISHCGVRNFFITAHLSHPTQV